MPKAKQPEPARKQTWAKTRAAVGAYARNPCAATEHDVEAAVEGIKHQSALDLPVAGAPKRALGKAKQR